MIYNRKLLKPLFEQIPLLKELKYTYGDITTSSYDMFCSYYSNSLPLYSDNDKENIARFIQIYSENAYLVEVLKQKQLLIAKLLQEDNYFARQESTQDSKNAASRDSAQKQNNTTQQNNNTKSISGDGRQNGDISNKNFTVESNLELIDNLSKSLNLDVLNSTNVFDSSSKDTSNITINNTSTLINKDTAKAIKEILNININEHLKTFWLKFKPLFNYNVSFNDRDILEPSKEYISEVLKPYIDKLLNSYDWNTLLYQKMIPEFNNYTSSKLVELVEQLKAYHSQEVNKNVELLNSANEKNLEQLNTQIETKAQEIRNLIPNADSIKNEVNNRTDDKLSKLFFYDFNQEDYSKRWDKEAHFQPIRVYGKYNIMHDLRDSSESCFNLKNEKSKDEFLFRIENNTMNYEIGSGDREKHYDIMKWDWNGNLIGGKLSEILSDLDRRIKNLSTDVDLNTTYRTTPKIKNFYTKPYNKEPLSIYDVNHIKNNLIMVELKTEGETFSAVRYVVDVNYDLKFTFFQINRQYDTHINTFEIELSENTIKRFIYHADTLQETEVEMRNFGLSVYILEV